MVLYSRNIQMERIPLICESLNILPPPFLFPVLERKLKNGAFINCASKSCLYSFVPLASLIGEISVCAVLIAAETTCLLISFPLRKADVFSKYRGTGPTPPADIAASSIKPLFIFIWIAEFTVAISRCVRLLTFSKLNKEFFPGNSNHILVIASPGFLSNCL